MVPPDTATDRPKVSYNAASDAVSFAVSVASAQPESGWANT